VSYANVSLESDEGDFFLDSIGPGEDSSDVDNCLCMEMGRVFVATAGEVAIAYAFAGVDEVPLETNVLTYTFEAAGIAEGMAVTGPDME